MRKVAWNKGKKWPKSVKKRISESRKGISAWNKGKPWPEEVINKISMSKMGQTAWNKGLNWPVSVRKKISRAKLANTLDIKPFYERNKPSSRLRFLVLNRDGSKCTRCGKTAEETVLEIDHVIPVSKGGISTIENLTTLCITCNRGKSDLEI